MPHSFSRFRIHSATCISLTPLASNSPQIDARSGDAKLLCVAGLERQTVPMSAAIRAENPARFRFEHTVEEQRLDPYVVVEVLEVAKPARRRARMRGDLRRAVTGQVDLARVT